MNCDNATTWRSLLSRLPSTARKASESPMPSAFFSATPHIDASMPTVERLPSWPELVSVSTTDTWRIQLDDLHRSEIEEPSSEDWTPRPVAIPSALERAATSLVRQTSNGRSAQTNNAWQHMGLRRLSKQMLTQSRTSRTAVKSPSHSLLSQVPSPPPSPPGPLGDLSLGVPRDSAMSITMTTDRTSEPPPSPTRELPTELCGECHDLEYTLVAANDDCATGVDYELLPIVCSCRSCFRTHAFEWLHA